MHGNYKIMTELLKNRILVKALTRASEKTENEKSLNIYRQYMLNDFFEFKEQPKTQYEPDKLYLCAAAKVYNKSIKTLNSDKKTVHAKITSISVDKKDVIVDITIDNNIQKQKLKRYFIDILENYNLLYKGAEFNFLYEKIEDGIQIKIQPYNSINMLPSKYYLELRDLWKKKIGECI